MRTPTVLIVEDSPSVRELLRTIVTRAGYAAVEAVSGASALTLASRHNPDLVLLDVELPILNGFMVCKKLRAATALSNLKIVMLTARATDEDRTLARAAGADAFVSKPFRPDELLKVVAGLLGAAEATATP